MKVLVILLVLIGITLFSIDDAFGAVGWTSQEIYDFSDIIAVGKVTNVNSTFSPTMNLYHIQVEKFLKNPQNSTELLALGSKTESIRAGNEVFDAGDRALFFLVDNIARMYPIYSGIYEVSTVSQSMDPNWDKCNIFEKNIPPDHWVFGGRSNHLHASQENKTDDFVTGKKITISHDIFNHEPVTKKVDFRMTIKNIDEPESLYEFTETAYRILEPCTVYETVSWSFTPSKPANYLAEFYDLKGNSIGITIPVQSDNDFSGLAPLKQFQSGIPFNEIQCKDGLVLIQKYDGSPACVTESTKTKLIERGWSLSSNNRIKIENTNLFLNYTMSSGLVKTAQLSDIAYAQFYYETMGVRLKEAHALPTEYSINLDLDSPEHKGTISIQIPKTIIASLENQNDDWIIKMGNGTITSQSHVKMEQNNSIKINYPDGTNRIKIIGSILE